MKVLPFKPQPADTAEIVPSKTLCTKALRHMLGPRAYFQTVRDDAEREIGLRAVTFDNDGRAIEFARATILPEHGIQANDPRLPLELLEAVARAVNSEAVAVREADGRISIEVRTMLERRVPVDMSPAAREDKIGRVDAQAEAVLCTALGALGVSLNAPTCEGCAGCDPTTAVLPCRAWAAWARDACDAARKEKRAARVSPNDAPPVPADPPTVPN